MREINLDRLRTLLAVAELGSFAQAARALHLAPPTVTQHVAELEARFGVALLLRGRRVVPTSAGQVLAARARRLLADLDELVADVRLHAKGQRGRVRLGASTGAIAHLLPPALRELARDHAGIDLQVSVTTSAETLARLAAGTLDLGHRRAAAAAAGGGAHPGLAPRPGAGGGAGRLACAPARLTPAWLAGAAAAAERRQHPSVAPDRRLVRARRAAADAAHRAELQRRDPQPGGRGLGRFAAAAGGRGRGGRPAHRLPRAAAGAVAPAGPGLARRRRRGRDPAGHRGAEGAAGGA